MNLKKWNWDAFMFILLLCALGLGTNRSIHSMLDWALATLVFGVPTGLLFAWMGREK